MPDPFSWIVAVSGSVAEEGPAITLYSPGKIVQWFAATSKIDRYNGSIFSVTVLLSPGLSATFSHPIKRLGGSPAEAGSER